MKAIIIQDHDAVALLKELELVKFKSPHNTNTEALSGRRTVEELAADIHGQFHYVVCRWLQDQGANVVR